MPFVLELVISLFLVAGALFALIGSIGLARLRDFFMRLHGPTKASTLGLGCLLIGSLLYFSFQRGGLSVHEAIVTVFLFVTAPVSAHMMAKAALFRGVDKDGPSRNYPDR
ncbi:Na+/H+ antiporter subunit G [Marinobacter alkaliphilus]|uniref:Na+/H+ antiporter subunit G n=1 Tax=Marinobacter alkaliphilus TaxID=254719 RepID=UPI003D76988D